VTGLILFFASFALGTSFGASVTVFNNFGPGDTFINNGGEAIGVLGSFGVKTAAMPFTSDANCTLDQVELAASLVSGANELDALLTNTVNGLPGSVLESYQFIGAMGLFATPNIPILSVNSLLHPLLQAGSEYWLLATSNQASVVWNNSTDTGVNAYRFDSDPWTTLNGSLGAFRITATPVPEPSTMLSMFFGLCGVICLIHKRVFRRLPVKPFGPKRTG
jgi:hypothetical protein